MTRVPTRSNLRTLALLLGAALAAAGPGRCPGCGNAGTYRDAVERRLTDLPLAGHPTQLRVRVPRFRCRRAGCVREVWGKFARRWVGSGSSSSSSSHAPFA